MTKKKKGTDSPSKERMCERLGGKKMHEMKGRMEMEERTFRHDRKDWSFSAGKGEGEARKRERLLLGASKRSALSTLERGILVILREENFGSKKFFFSFLSNQKVLIARTQNRFWSISSELKLNSNQTNASTSTPCSTRLN